MALSLEQFTGGGNSAHNQEHILRAIALILLETFNTGAIVGPGGSATLSEQVSQSVLLANLITELQLKADLTETQPVSLAESNLKTLQREANDLDVSLSFLDPLTADKRISTITYTGTTSPVTPAVVKTFTYSGGPGAYLLTNITLS